MAILRFPVRSLLVQHTRLRCLSIVNYAQFTTNTSKSLSSPKTNSRSANVSQTLSELQLLPTALKAFHAKYKHFGIPVGFIIPLTDVPEDDDFLWPVDVRGYKLSKTVWQFLRSREKKKLSMGIKQVEKELQDIGFPLQIIHFDDLRWFEVWEPALKAYYKLNGHTIVPRNFIVPNNDEQWPRGAWGCALGPKVHNLRQLGDKLSLYKRECLAKLDFSYDVVETKWTKQIMPSLLMYWKIHGDCLVPHTFIVPSTYPWPRIAWELKLGHAVRRIRKQQYQRQVERDSELLKKIDFSWNVINDNFHRVILPALETFVAKYNHSIVRKSFVVPFENPWPKQTWNLKLGAILENIRSKESYKNQVQSSEEKLRELGCWHWLTGGKTFKISGRLSDRT